QPARTSRRIAPARQVARAALSLIASVLLDLLLEQGLDAARHFRHHLARQLELAADLLDLGLHGEELLGRVDLAAADPLEELRKARLAALELAQDPLGAARLPDLLELGLVGAGRL